MVQAEDLKSSPSSEPEPTASFSFTPERVASISSLLTSASSRSSVARSKGQASLMTMYQPWEQKRQHTYSKFLCCEHTTHLELHGWEYKWFWLGLTCSTDRCKIGPMLFLLPCSKAMEFSPFWHPSRSILPCFQTCIKHSLPQTIQWQVISNYVFILVCMRACVCVPSNFNWCLQTCIKHSLPQTIQWQVISNYVFILVCMRACVCVPSNFNWCLHTFVCVCVFVCACMHVCVYVGVSMRACVCVGVHE